VTLLPTITYSMEESIARPPWVSSLSLAKLTIPLPVKHLILLKGTSNKHLPTITTKVKVEVLHSLIQLMRNALQSKPLLKLLWAAQLLVFIIPRVNQAACRTLRLYPTNSNSSKNIHRVTLRHLNCRRKSVISFSTCATRMMAQHLCNQVRSILSISVIILITNGPMPNT